MIENIKNMLSFMRFTVSMSGSFIAVLAYLLTNQLDFRFFIVMLGSFFACTVIYSYNNLTDKKEDSINRKQTNTITKNNFSHFLIFLFLFLSLIFQYILSTRAMIFSIIFIALGILYSFFRLKKYLLIKNIYTGFGMIPMFLSGTINQPFDQLLINYSLFFAIFITVGSIVSDLRDYKGDKASNFNTIPVYFGYDNAKKITYSSISALSLVILYLNILKLLPLIIFMPLTIYFIYTDKPKRAHLSGGISIIILLVYLIIFSL